MNIKVEICDKAIELIDLLANMPLADDEFVDEADRKFYEVAKHCGATLITGNIKHFPSDEIIMTANDFLEKYL